MQGSFIPDESTALAGLGEVVRQSVRSYVTVVGPDRQVTLDVDAHRVGSSEREALAMYEGGRGYQPLLVTCAQTGLVLATSSGTAMCRHRRRSPSCWGNCGSTGKQTTPKTCGPSCA